MGRPRKVTQMVSKDEKPPAFRIEFAGKYQRAFFELHRMGGEASPKLTGTGYARRVLCDHVALYRHHKSTGNAGRAEQMILNVTKEKKEG
jgi:hypothetical protein